MQARSAAALRLQIEHALERSFPAALSPAPCTVYETAPTGLASIDTLLHGGLPVGAISELTGPRCSGRTSFALSFLAQQTSEGHVCAWVDVDDAFDPESAAASGLHLNQLLWVRCQKAAGNSAKPFVRIDQALRATDLLLQAGGFAAIVLDLGDAQAEHARRIPLATWFRFRQAAGRSRTCLLLLAQVNCAQSSAAVALEFSPLQPITSGDKVLRGFHYQVNRDRLRATPFVPGQRKPPTSTWHASGSWNVEESA